MKFYGLPFVLPANREIVEIFTSDLVVPANSHGGIIMTLRKITIQYVGFIFILTSIIYCKPKIYLKVKSSYDGSCSYFVVFFCVCVEIKISG